jgi:hypothetical protein
MISCCLNSTHISGCSNANSLDELLSVQNQLEMRLLELIWEQLTHVLLLWRERSATPNNFPYHGFISPICCLLTFTN